MMESVRGFAFCTNKAPVIEYHIGPRTVGIIGAKNNTIDRMII